MSLMPTASGPRSAKSLAAAARMLLRASSGVRRLRVPGAAAGDSVAEGESALFGALRVTGAAGCEALLPRGETAGLLVPRLVLVLIGLVMASLRRKVGCFQANFNRY
jgi:hypothetical protein